jgi:hypothetical protein
MRKLITTDIMDELMQIMLDEFSKQGYQFNTDDDDEMWIVSSLCVRLPTFQHHNIFTVLIHLFGEELTKDKQQIKPVHHAAWEIMYNFQQRTIDVCFDKEDYSEKPTVTNYDLYCIECMQYEHKVKDQYTELRDACARGQSRRTGITQLDTRQRYLA